MSVARSPPKDLTTYSQASPKLWLQRELVGKLLSSEIRIT